MSDFTKGVMAGFVAFVLFAFALTVAYRQGYVSGLMYLPRNGVQP